MKERDLSQARIKPGYVLSPEEVSEPAMSEADWRDTAEGVRLFNAGEFWESHEAWEHVWRRITDPTRVFFQALIQTAAAYHQLERGVYHGVIKHFRNAATKLAPFPDSFLGVDVGAIKSALDAGLEEATRLGADRLDRFDRDLIVRIAFKPPDE